MQIGLFAIKAEHHVGIEHILVEMWRFELLRCPGIEKAQQRFQARILRAGQMLAVQGLEAPCSLSARLLVALTPST